jgi:hypothetical protein
MLLFEPERPAAFAKLPPPKTRSARRHAQNPEEHPYGDEEFRRGVWLIATVLLVMLGVGGALVFSGLL